MMSLSEWHDQNLDAVVDIIDGDRGTNYPTQHEFSVYEHCLFLNAGNVTQNGFNFSNCSFITKEKDEILRKGKLQRQDIVLTTRGTVGNIAYFDSFVPFKNIRINSGMVIFRPNIEKIDPLFLYIFLRSKVFSDQVRGLTTGSAQPQLPIRDIRRISLPLPDMNSQKAIAAVLGALDDKIELNRKMNATLEAMARALFKSWFVDFDPVRAKMEGRQPFGMDAETAAIFPSRLVSSDLGDIPEGWTENTLQTLAEINPEAWGENSHPDSVEYVDLANTKWGVIESTVIYAWGDAPSRARRVLKSGDSIVGTVRPGNGSFAYISCDYLTGSTGFAVLRPKKEIFREAVFCCVTAAENIERLTHLADGGAYPAVRPEVVLNTTFLFSSLKILEAFSKKAAPLLEKIEFNKNESKQLASLRDYLLPKLVSGDIRIPAAEKFVASRYQRCEQPKNNEEDRK